MDEVLVGVIGNSRAMGSLIKIVANQVSRDHVVVPADEIQSALDKLVESKGISYERDGDEFTVTAPGLPLPDEEIERGITIKSDQERDQIAVIGGYRCGKSVLSEALAVFDRYQKSLDIRCVVQQAGLVPDLGCVTHGDPFHNKHSRQKMNAQQKQLRQRIQAKNLAKSTKAKRFKSK